ncbi:MAG: hypothetical protein ACFHWX_22995 [Bacteroidota bacterium]
MDVVTIDVRSLMVMLALCNLFIFFFFLGYIIHRKESSELFWVLILSKLINSMAWVLFILRGNIHNIFSLNMANTLLLFATCYEAYYVIYATQTFNRNKFWKYNLFPFVLSFIFNLLSGQPESTRVVIMSLFFGSIFLYCALQLYKQKRSTSVHSLISYFYFLLAAFFLFKPLFNSEIELFNSGSFIHLIGFTLGLLTTL